VGIAGTGTSCGGISPAGADQSVDPVFLTRLAGLYLDAGNDLYRRKTRRLRAYEEGAQVAHKVLELQETNAEAHFLYAANLGSAARLSGPVASALTIRTVKTHVTRALELEPDHAPALHMMGRMLEELPEVLGGDLNQALNYLQQAVAADPTYTHARLSLAKLYIEKNNKQAARKELETILKTDSPRNSYTWARRHKPEAKKLLKSMKP